MKPRDSQWRGRKLHVYIPPEMLVEIRDESLRLGTTISAVMRRAWRAARPSIAELASSSPVSALQIAPPTEEPTARETFEHRDVQYELAVHPDRGGASVYVRDRARGESRYVGAIDMRRGTGPYFPGVELKYRAAFHAIVRHLWPPKP